MRVVYLYRRFREVEQGGVICWRLWLDVLWDWQVELVIISPIVFVIVTLGRVVLVALYTVYNRLDSYWRCLCGLEVIFVSLPSFLSCLKVFDIMH